MRYIWQHIATILQTYTGTVPLAHFLKAYFRQYPKLGSRDRKILSEMAYCWYRCSKALPATLSLEEQVRAALLLCGPALPQAMQFLPQQWQEKVQPPMTEKIALLDVGGVTFRLHDLLPFEEPLSEGIRQEDWLQSMLRQPVLFIRIRKKSDAIKALLTENDIPFTEVTPSCLSLPNAAPVDKLLPADAYVIQDVSSQRTGGYFLPKRAESWWDCCSGAGGKSLLLKDLEPSVQLTVSDKRASILHNLKERFRLYGHKAEASVITDAANANDLQQHFAGMLFDNIIADVPCSGSGTWARTPEQLYFFTEDLAKQYAEQQKAIAGNASLYLKPGGRMLYVTCSVFRKENEEVVDYLCSNFGLNLEDQQLINGIELKADSMFIAVLGK